jgi:hypothetical protein
MSLLDFQLDAGERLEQGRLRFGELGRRGEDRDGAILAFDVFDGDIRGEHRLDHSLLVVTIERKYRQVIEGHDNGTIGSHLGTRLVEADADFGDGACHVVGQAIDNE